MCRLMSTEAIMYIWQPGAKINENLTIADHVIVGSNCDVTHSVEYESAQ